MQIVSNALNPISTLLSLDSHNFKLSPGHFFLNSISKDVAYPMLAKEVLVLHLKLLTNVFEIFALRTRVYKYKFFLIIKWICNYSYYKKF
jgi:hypothetical protein